MASSLRGLRFVSKILEKKNKLTCRLISTTDKAREANVQCPPPESVYKKVPDFSKPRENKNWVSFGFHPTDESEDKFTMHVAYFSMITIGICVSGFLYYYYPDKNREEWAVREAFIRLYEREQLGLDPIDPNYVDPATINLPPDEELAEEDIII